jgi:hypothetical protein
VVLVAKSGMKRWGKISGGNPPTSEPTEEHYVHLPPPTEWEVRGKRKELQKKPI